MTHGYTGADLASLVREAAMYALRRYLPKIDLNQDKIPPDVLDSMRVTMDDFMKAFKEIVPSGLREIYIEIPEVKWTDIGGHEELKDELREVVEYPLKYPEVYEKAGIDPAKGILLFGPPGTGKTMLAKAVATESGANFIAVRGPEVLSKWVGESEKAIREIFRKARMYAPAVIFFDEIDALAPMRGASYDSGVTERLVNQLLAEMDGVENLENVIIIAATNRPDILDPALLRPGRFEKLLYVPPPDKDSRQDILRVHTKGIPIDEDAKLTEIATRTEGYTGADIAALVREAAMRAVRESMRSCIEIANEECKQNQDCKDNHVRECMKDKVKVTAKHFDEAMAKIKPSVTHDMIQFYQNWLEKARQQLPKAVVKPSTFT
jgi:transitional endoplasmic reticulum ATPase